MKYTIAGYSQKVLLAHGLDCRDAELLRWLVDFQASGKMKTYVEDEAVYYWIDHQHVIDELPILGRSTLPSVGKYINQLVEKGTLEKKTDRRGVSRGTAVYYRVAPTLMRELTTDTPDDHRNDRSSAELTTSTNGLVPLAQMGRSDSSISDSSTKRTKEEEGDVVDKASRTPISREPEPPPTAQLEPAPPVIESTKGPEEHRIRDLLAYQGIKPDTTMKRQLSDFKNKHGVDALAELITAALRDGMKPAFFNEDFIPYLNKYAPAKATVPRCKKHGRLMPSGSGCCDECNREKVEKATPEERERAENLLAELAKVGGKSDTSEAARVRAVEKKRKKLDLQSEQLLGEGPEQRDLHLVKAV